MTYPPHQPPPEIAAKAIKMYTEKGEAKKYIAKTLYITERTFSRICREAGIRMNVKYPASTTHKRCSHCDGIKPMQEFRKSNEHMSGISSLCVPCWRIRQREYIKLYRDENRIELKEKR